MLQVPAEDIVGPMLLELLHILQVNCTSARKVPAFWFGRDILCRREYDAEVFPSQLRLIAGTCNPILS